jgi:hypothetical protein
MGLAELIGSLRSVTNCVHGVGRGGVVWCAWCGSAHLLNYFIITVRER